MAQPNPRSITSPAMLERRLNEARALQPLDWSSDLVNLRRQYEGQIQAQMLAAAAMRFPMTSHRMPRTPFNWAEVVGKKGATIYDEPPRREVIGDDDAPLPDDDADARDFADMIEGARLSVVMPEADAVRVLAKSCVLSIRPDTIEAQALGRPARTVVDMLWSNDVLVIVHPHAPTSLQAALEVFVRSSGSPGCTTWVHWMHDVVIEEDGRTSKMGAWSSEIITVRTLRTKGLFGIGASESTTLEVRQMWAPYPLPHLPLVAMNAGIPAGMPFADGNRNLVQIFNTVNTGLMSEVYTGDMTAAPVLAHTTNQPQPANVTMGPGVKVNLLKDEKLESVTQVADLAGLRATNESLLNNLATTTHQPQGSYTGDEGAESGVALKVKSIPASRARRLSKEITRPMEQDELLPIMAEVNDYVTGSKILKRAKRFRCTYVDPPDFETPGEKQSRLAEAVDIGWIGKPRAAVEAGYYKTEQEATTAIDEIDEEKQARMGPGLLNQPPEGGGDPPNPDDVDLGDDDAKDKPVPPKPPPPTKAPPGKRA